MNTQHPLEALRPHLGPNPVHAILDLGGGAGASAAYLCRTFPTAKVYSFECSPTALAACRSRLAGTTVEVIPLAVTRHSGRAELCEPGTNSPSASLLPSISGTSIRSQRQVECTRLDTWCAERNISADVVWCDIEGDPLAALEGLGDRLRTVRGVYVAVSYRPIYRGQPSFRDIDSLLRNAGHRLVQHVQCNPGQWGYAIFAKEIAIDNRLATTNGPDDSVPFARGGIGDLLQYLPAAIAASRIRVFSHYSGATEFFSRVGVAAEHTPFDANTCSIAWQDLGEELPRTTFPVLPLPPPAIELPAVRGRVLGIHPFGSAYSNTFADRGGAPPKWMPSQFMSELLQQVLRPDDHILLFCANHELHHVATTLGDFSDRATIASCSNPWDSFSLLPRCDAVVAVDSSVKTASAMLRKPTVTLVGDFPEPFRDRHFLDPYVRAGVMKTVKYTTMAAREAHLTARALRDLGFPA